MDKEEFDKDPRYNGQPLIDCMKCRKPMKPYGRDGPLDFYYSAHHYCAHDFGPALWSGETRESYGFPSYLVREAGELRAQFYPEDSDGR